MCEKVCSGHCLNNTICDYIDGRCSDGCQPGYIGTLCNDCKISKFYFSSVLNCSFVTVMFHICFIVVFFFILQLARKVIMEKTVLVFAPQLARHANLLTAHALVMLVGWGLTVELVIA